MNSAGHSEKSPSRPGGTDGNASPTLDEIYTERNLLAQLVAALAQSLHMPVGQGIDPAQPAWPLIYVDLPTGQLSWHIPQHELVVELVRYPAAWDGHSPEERQQRILSFLAQFTAQG